MNLEEFYVRAHDIGADIAGHLDTLRRYASTAQQIIEVGAGHGNSSSAFLLGLAESGGTLWSVDLESTSITDELLALCPEWEYHLGDSLHLEPEAPFGVDVLFIDSDHSFDSTLAELRAYTPHVKPGGVVLLHDTGDHQPGVMRAIVQFCEENNLRWSNVRECYGLGTIYL